MVSATAASHVPAEGMMRSTALLATLGFGFSAWAVCLAGLISVHMALSHQRTLAEYDGFACAWLVVCAFIVLWVAILLCWRRGVMPTTSRVLTPMIVVLMSWLGVVTHEVLHLTLKAYKANTVEARTLVWAIGLIACGVCLGVMLIIVAGWEVPPVHDIHTIKAFRQHHRGNHSAKAGTNGALRTQASGGTSNRVYNASGNSADQWPFGIPIPGDSQSGNINPGHSASPSGAVDVSVSLGQKGP